METEKNVFDFAMGLELKSVELYENLARQTPFREVASIFRYLAGEEKSHYEIVKAWRSGSPAPVPEESPFFPELDKVFRKLSDHFNENGVPANHYYHAYEKARVFEEKTLALYKNLLETIEDDRKILLMRIIDQEKNHAMFISNLLELLRHPGEWLENAEWYHLEEY